MNASWVLGFHFCRTKVLCSWVAHHSSSPGPDPFHDALDPPVPEEGNSTSCGQTATKCFGRCDPPQKHHTPKTWFPQSHRVISLSAKRGKKTKPKQNVLMFSTSLLYQEKKLPPPPLREKNIKKKKCCCFLMLLETQSFTYKQL